MDRIKGLIDRYKIASADDWSQWFNISKIRKLDKGEILIPEGEISKVCAFVLKGTFKSVSYNSDDCEKILNFGFETDFLASCESYNSQIPSAFSITAMENSEVMVTNNDELVKLCYANQNIANLGFILTQQVMQQHEDHLNILTLANPVLKYQHILKHKQELLMKVSLTDLAKYLYISREALSRARKQIIGASD